MHSSLSRVKYPLMAAALVFTVGVASAMDYYYYNQPSACSPCATIPAPAPAPMCNPCAGGPTATNLPGWYSNDYDYTTSSQVDTGITYVIPQQNGYIESHTIPLTNPVDQYYATHQVRNGQVVETGLPNPTNRNMAYYDENGNMIRSYTQYNANSPAQNAMQANANQTQATFNQAQSNLNQARTDMNQPLPAINQTRATITQTQTTLDVPALGQTQSMTNQTTSSTNRTQAAINQAQNRVDVAQQDMRDATNSVNRALNSSTQTGANQVNANSSFYDNVLSRDADSTSE